MRRILLSLLLVTTSATAPSAQADRATTCKLVMPEMLKFVSVISDLDPTFNSVYEQFSDEDKQRFSLTRDKSKELADVAEEYKSAFMSACLDQ